MAKYHNNKVKVFAENQVEEPVEAIAEVIEENVKVVKYVDCVSLNVRNEPNASGRVVTQINKGCEVEVIRSIDPKWDEIMAGNVYGYVMSEFLTDERR